MGRKVESECAGHLSTLQDAAAVLVGGFAECRLWQRRVVVEHAGARDLKWGVGTLKHSRALLASASWTAHAGCLGRLPNMLPLHAGVSGRSAPC